MEGPAGLEIRNPNKFNVVEVMADMASIKRLLAELLGAAAGAVLGFFAFFWVARQGFYAMVLPGALLGLGGGLLARDRSVLRATICGVLALALGLFTEWRFRPFYADPGLGYFLAHVHQLQPLTLAMIAAGGGLAVWLALGRERR